MVSWLNDFGHFGLSFGAGALLGYFASFLMMGHFYDFRNEKGILPEITIHFHWQLLLAFCGPSNGIFYAYRGWLC